MVKARKTTPADPTASPGPTGRPPRPDDPVSYEYGRLAADYDRRWSRYVEGTVRETLVRLSPGADDRVLDIGCGTGVLLAALAPTVPGPALVGIDATPEMLGVARTRLGRRVALCAARAGRLPFADRSFDLVVSTSVLHYVRHPDEALREIARVLAPAGRVVITDWCTDYPPCRVLDRLLRLGSPAYHRAYGAAELATLLRDAGFTAVSVERFRIGLLWGMMTACGRKPAAP